MTIRENSMNIAKIIRPNLSVLKEYVPGKPIEEVQREYGIQDVIKLASNENPLGASPKALAAMIAELSRYAHLYPDGSSLELVQKIANNFGVTPAQVYIDSGLDAVIGKLGLTFMDPGDEIVLSQYSFPVYESTVIKMNAKAVLVPQTVDFRVDIPAIIRAVTPRTKIICLCNPNNPTGTIFTQSEFETLLAGIPEDVLIVCDEAYYEFAEDDAFPESMDYLSRTPNLLVMRTFSKVFGLASVRVGFAIGHQDVIGALLKVREAFAVNRAAQAGALAALDDDEFVRQTIAANRAGRQQYYQAFKRLGIRYYPSQTNFIFFEVDRPGVEIYQAMLRRGVIIRPLTSQGLTHHLRISVGTAGENERAIAALEQALKA
jgi:histidinol-phosphate aminotransferase